MAAEPRMNPSIDDHMNLFRRLEYPSLQLPPLQDPIPSLSASRPLPLEPSASANRDAHASSAPQYSISASRGSAASRAVASGGPANGEKVARSIDETAQGIDKSSLPPSSTRDRSLREGAEEAVESRQAASSRKRQRVEQHDEANNDYLQLPKMCKDRTHSGDAPLLAGLDHIVSPLNGPSATAAGTSYSSGAPSAFEDAHGRNALNGPLSIIRETGSAETAETSTKESKEKAAKRETRRPRRKWGEQETDHLLQGVALYGVGSWKKILEHPEFKFDARSSIDLKDRFRTCFPQEYRKHLDSRPSNSDSTELSQRSTPKSRPLPSIISENILNLDDSPTSSTSATSPKEISPSPPKRPRKSRTDRKNTDDLARLGIAGPFKKAQRRERRAFTDEEDAALLRGFHMHGPLWSTIQSDPSLNLSSRRPMDVRDRFRNRYPEKYAEAGYKTRPKNHPKSPLRTNGKEGDEEPPTLSAPLPNNFDQRKSKDSRQMVNTEEPQNSSQNNLLDFGDGTLPPFGQSTGESDIQRLLLDHIHPLATWNASRAHIATVDSQQSRNDLDQTIDPSSSQNPLHHQTTPSVTNTQQQTQNQAQQQQQQNLPTLQKSTINPRSQPFPFFSTLPPLVDPLDSVFAQPASTFLNSNPVGGGDKYPAIAELMRHAGEDRRFGGDAGVGVAGLNWEDMATHPMFDIDTGNGVGGTEDGVGRGR